ncbi:MAG: hypothetical protein WA003_05475 [Desulfuromonadaceae bacterium]
MKKFFLILIPVLALLIAGGIMLANFVLERASDKALEYLAAEGASRGVKVEFAKFENVGFKGVGAVRWSDFVTVIDAPRYISIAPGEQVLLSIGEINLDLMRLFQGVAAITSFDIGLRVQRSPTSAENSDAQIEGFDEGQLMVELPLNFTDKGNAAASIAEIPKRALQFLQEGNTQVPFDFRAKSTFKIGGAVVRADITTKERGGYYFLVMSPDDLRKIAAILKADFTEEEIRLVSLRPLLAPAIFKITNFARTQAAAAYAKDATVPEDAYRHVLWSFLLTREFGPEFAKQVTDAHEIGAIKFNTEADHRMDYNNNKVGRDYAKAGHAEGLILQMVRTDPGVVRVSQP